MKGHCPYCGDPILSNLSNFCTKCGLQLREISPEDAVLIASEEERQKPMPVKEAVVLLSRREPRLM